MDYDQMPLPEHIHPGVCSCEPVGAYLRVSKVGDRGEDLLSPELQLHTCTTYAHNNKQRIVRIVPDIDKSGRSFRKRRTDEMGRDLKAGTYRQILVWRWDRWGRNPKESLVWIEELQKLVGGNQVVQSATEPFDTSTTVGEFTRDQLLLIARLQSNQIRDSWKNVHARRRRDQTTHNGQRRFGYSYDRKAGYTLKEPEASALRDAYIRIITGDSLRAIAFEWNERGLTSTRGNPFSPQTLREMLLTGFGAGYIREHSKPSPENKARQRPEDFDDWRVGKHESVITLEEWEAFKAKMNENREKAPRWVWAMDPLAGLLLCGVCGDHVRMVIANSREYRKWICPRVRDYKAHPNLQVRAHHAEATVLDWIDEIIEGGEDIQAKAEAVANATEATGLAEDLAGKIASIKRERRKIADGYLAGAIAEEDAIAQRAEFDAEIERLTAKLRAAQLAATRAQASPLPAFTTLRAGWETYTAHGKREMLERLVYGFRVLPAEVSRGPVRLAPLPRWLKMEDDPATGEAGPSSEAS